MRGERRALANEGNHKSPTCYMIGTGGIINEHRWLRLRHFYGDSQAAQPGNLNIFREWSSCVRFDPLQHHSAIIHNSQSDLSPNNCSTPLAKAKHECLIAWCFSKNVKMMWNLFLRPDSGRRYAVCLSSFAYSPIYRKFGFRIKLRAGRD